MKTFKGFLAVLLTTAILASAVVVSFSASAKEREFILGDADSDGNVTVMDATAIQKKLASIETSSFNENAADVDRDSKVTILDATYIQEYLASLPCPDGIGEPIDAEPEQPVEIEHKLLSGVNAYGKDYETGEWELSLTTTIEYDEHGYPVLFDSLDSYEDAEHVLTNITYTYDEDIPLTRTEINEREGNKTNAEYLNGRVLNEKDESDNGSYTKRMYQYGHGDDYFTMVLHDQLRIEPEPNPDIHMEEVDSVSVTTENGLLKSTTNTGMYAYWSEREEKKWIRFRGIYTADYDSDGIVCLMTSNINGVGIIQERKIELTKKAGVIVEAIVWIPNADGGWDTFKKYEFEYNDTQISAQRYSLMMNKMITEGGGNYYIFNWY